MPINFEPTIEEEDNLAYEHADIGKQELPSGSELHAKDEAQDADPHHSSDASDGTSDTDEEETTWDAFCVTPCGKKIHKSALVAEMNRCLGMGIALSPDRLIAVRGGPSDAFAARAGAKAVEADVNRNVITRGCHVLVEGRSTGRWRTGRWRRQDHAILHCTHSQDEEALEPWFNAVPHGGDAR